jgi:ABC-2 type transport system ATP-binding protein
MTASVAPGGLDEVGITARELTRRFGDHVALDRLSLEIAPRSCFGLLGTNGAGKTTFIRMVTGFLLPSAGELTVGGISPAEHPTRVNSRLGFVTETSRLYPELRVLGLLRFLGGARGLRGVALRTAIDRVIEDFHLESVAKRPTGNLSKGYQQRVSLAQAFLHNPALVVVDEPTVGLDPLQQDEVRQILRGFRGTRTVLLCTHDLGEARSLTDHVAILNAGKLVAKGPTEEVLSSGDAMTLFGKRSGAKGSTQ